MERPSSADGEGLAVCQFIRSYRRGHIATLCAFDLIEIDGEDLRWQPIEDRKAALKKLLSQSHPGIAFNKHFDVEGAVVFHHACKLGCEGIVSKRLGSPYRFGRSTIGSRSRTQPRPRSSARRKRIGAAHERPDDRASPLPATFGRSRITTTLASS